MGQHKGDVAERRERGQRIKVFYSSILFLGFNSFFWLGHDLGLNLAGLNGAFGAWLGRVQAPKKNPFSKLAGSRPWVLAHGLGPSMEKPGPNPTHCRSYSLMVDWVKYTMG